MAVSFLGPVRPVFVCHRCFGKPSPHTIRCMSSSVCGNGIAPCGCIPVPSASSLPPSSLPSFPLRITCHDCYAHAGYIQRGLSPVFRSTGRYRPARSFHSSIFYGRTGTWSLTHRLLHRTIFFTPFISASDHNQDGRCIYTLVVSSEVCFSSSSRSQIANRPVGLSLPWTSLTGRTRLYPRLGP